MLGIRIYFDERGIKEIINFGMCTKPDFSLEIYM